MSNVEQFDVTKVYVTTWKGHPNYECRKCAFCTLIPDNMKEHLAKGKHPWGRETPPPPIPPAEESAIQN